MVLGPVGAVGDEQRTDLGGDRQRTLAAVLLAARGEAVSTERLIDGLWGPRPPPGARKTLQSYVARMRRCLRSLDAEAEPVVATVATGYRMDLGTCELDAAHFERLVARARRRGTEPAEAVDLLERAEALWKGPAFGELASHELVREEARRLDQLRAAATNDRIDLKLALGHHRDVLGSLEALVSRDPLNERVQAQRMLALYRSGHQADALATYRRLRQRLADEVGIDPSEDLQRLHEQILRQDAALAAPSSRTAASSDDRAARRPSTDAPQTGHPAGGQTLIGRDEELADLAALVEAVPLVTLIGPGGVGKTRLAEQVADVFGDRYQDGVVCCPLAVIREPSSVVTALVDALGARHRGGRPPEETLVGALSTRRVLLVIDNCEHLVSAVASVVESILASCPNVALLATSREPLRVASERVWQVAPLAVPPRRATTAGVGQAPAGALFIARARAAAPSFALTEDNAATVAELCRRLDGIPLAIELAAARVRAMSVDELLTRIDRRFALLTGGPHREDGRHRTLEAVVAWSYDALDEVEARLFDRLSVFAGSFTLAAAERICADGSIREPHVAGLVAELVDKSMVVVDRVGADTRYRLLDTLRTYGAARLAESGETVRFQRAHATYHIEFAEEFGPRVRGREEHEALAQIDASIDDLRVAHAWLVTQLDTVGALRLPAALQDYIGHRQRDEVYEWAERALALPGAAGHRAHPPALATAARGATRRGDLERARRYAESALAQVEPTSLTAAWANHAQATAALYEGRLDDVLTLTDQRSELREAPGEDYYAALSLTLRVLGHLYRGDTDAAAAEAEELSAAAAAAGNRHLRAWALYCRGETLLDADPFAAAPLLEAAIDAARRVEGRLPEGVAMVSLASLRGRTGDEKRAVDLFAEVIAHWRQLGDWTHQVTTLRNLVELLVGLGLDEQAAVLHGAVGEVSPPSFGAEAERLDDAWGELERRLGADQAIAAAERGRQLGPAAMVDEALAILDGLRAS
jgi:predicted ATPase/DNA-binding SARP family transcriptional activator